MSGLIFYGQSTAQIPGGGSSDEACPAIVSDALAELESSCAGIGRNAACYGNNNVLADFNREFEEAFFTSPGELADLIDVNNIETGPLDIDNRLWGIALMNVQANIPGTLPGQNVVMMLLGDTYVENDVPEESAFTSDTTVPVTTSRDVPLTENPDGTVVLATIPSGTQIAADAVAENGAVRVSFGEQFGWIAEDAVAMPRTLAVLPTVNAETRTPMQAFYFSTGIGNSNCTETPDSLIVQGPENLVVDIRANGADITIGSTIALVSYENLSPPQMELFVLEDQATITCPDGTEVIIEEGFSTRGTLTDLIDLGVNNFVDNRLVECDWSEPEPVPPARILEIAGPSFNVSDDVFNYELELPLVEVVAQAPTEQPTQPPVFGGVRVVPSETPLPTLIPPTSTPVPPPPGVDDEDNDNNNVVTTTTSDVGVSVFGSTNLANEGDGIFFDIVVANNDTTAAATGVSVGTNFISLPYTFSGATAGSGTYDSASGIWTVGDIPAGGSVILTVNVTVNGGTAGNAFTLTGTVSASSADSNAGNNSGSASVTITSDPLADPSLTLFSEVTDGTVGDTLLVNVDAFNNSGSGTVNAETVSVTLNLNSLPFTLVSAVPTQGTYNTATGVWTVGTLTPGMGATLDLNIQASAAGTYTLDGDLTSTNDGNTTNNSDFVTFTVGAPVDGAVTLVANPVTVTEGNAIAFTYTVTNTSTTASLLGATVSTDLAALTTDFTYTSDVPSQGTYDNVSGFWDVGDIGPGGSATLIVNVTAATGASGGSPFTIFATLNATNDSNAGNNTANTIVGVVQAPAEVEVTDAAFTLGTVTSGTADDFTVVITNTDASTAVTNITVTIGGLPAFTENGSTAEPGSAYGGGTWTIPSIAPLGTATLVLNVNGPVGTNTLSATITGADNDTLTGNNFASDTLTVNGLADLGVALVFTPQDVTAGQPGPTQVTMTVTNNGPEIARDVIAEDDLATFPVFQGPGTVIQQDGNSYDYGIGTWDIGDINVGQTVTLQFDLPLDTGAAPGQRQVTFEISSSTTVDDDNSGGINSVLEPFDLSA
ncbi:MAG: DUF11 domain-containing protein [Chloroflexota bacterium]